MVYFAADMEIYREGAPMTDPMPGKVWEMWGVLKNETEMLEIWPLKKDADWRRECTSEWKKLRVVKVLVELA